jgi:hypothetical protein
MEDSIGNRPGDEVHCFHSEHQFTLEEARDAAKECSFFEWFTEHNHVRRLCDDHKLIWRYGGIAGKTQIISFGVIDPEGRALFQGGPSWGDGTLMMIALPGKHYLCP